MAVELQVSPKNGQPTGCAGLTSLHESNKTRTLRKTCGPLADCWQGYEQCRWSIATICMKQPLACLINVSPLLARVGRISISNIFWLILIIVLQFVLIRDWFTLDVDDDAEYWYFVGLYCGEAASLDYGLVWILAQRNTLMNVVFGVPMERSIKYHKYVAWLAIFWSWMHFILIIQYWFDLESFEDLIEEEHSISGVIMLSSVTCIFFFTLDYVRRNYWEFFLKSHWILFCIFLWSAIKHDSHFTTGVFMGAIILWLFDLLWRGMLIFLWGKPGIIQKIEAKPGGVVKITWKNDDLIFEGGQYAFICIPAIDLTQWHPFSISSGPDDGVKTFHIRALGDFTEKLAKLAKHDVADWTRLQAYMEGPYGKLEVPLDRYKRIVLISGGIGITPMQALWSDLMTMIENGVKFEEIHFVWYIRDPAMVDEFDTIHWNAVQRINGPNTFAHTIKINGETTLKTTYVFTKVSQEHQRYNELQQRFGDGFVTGRPNVKQFIDATASGNNKNTTVLGCGPGRMLEDIKNYTATQGIDCHTEVFTF